MELAGRQYYTAPLVGGCAIVNTSQLQERCQSGWLTCRCLSGVVVVCRGVMTLLNWATGNLPEVMLM